MTTKQAAPATPLPWRTLKQDAAFPIYHAEDGRVCTLHYASGVKAQHDCQRQDSEYIVAACNAYPRLMAEREELVAALRQIWIANEQTLCERSDGQIEAGDAARALLARLEGAE